jgi:hypothetical protein
MSDRGDALVDIRSVLDRHNIPTRYQKVWETLRTLERLKVPDPRSRMDSKPIQLMVKLLDLALSARETELKQAIIESVSAAK